MATKELKQIWNSAVAVSIAVATIVVAILEQRQRKFRAGYLQNCDLQFPNLTYVRLKLPFTLIFNYKRSTHHKEWREPSPKEKNTKKQKKNKIQERDWRLHKRKNCRDQLGAQSFLSLSCFRVFYLFMGMCFMAETLFFIFLLQTMN